MKVGRFNNMKRDATGIVECLFRSPRKQILLRMTVAKMVGSEENRLEEQDLKMERASRPLDSRRRRRRYL